MSNMPECLLSQISNLAQAKPLSATRYEMFAQPDNVGEMYWFIV